jgi:hypothetical protein
LTDGSVAELSERVAALAATTAEIIPSEGHVDLPIHAFGEARAWAEIADTSQFDETVGRWRERLRALSASADPGDIEGLTAVLRDYQRTGVAWLQFLAELGVGGILADDMGLGKTVQTLALLCWRAARDGRAPSLVVAPTSVAPNWLRESERFTIATRTFPSTTSWSPRTRFSGATSSASAGSAFATWFSTKPSTSRTTAPRRPPPPSRCSPRHASP